MFTLLTSKVSIGPFWETERSKRWVSPEERIQVNTELRVGDHWHFRIRLLLKSKKVSDFVFKIS